MTISSAGVFTEGGVLVRTLWAAVDNHDKANDPASFWDGRLDDRSVAPSGTYKVKKLQHSVTYTMEGYVGNTSPDHVDNLEYHMHGTPMVDMTITAAGEMYFGHGYDERWNTMHVATEDNIQEAKYVLFLGNRTAYNSPICICNDNDRVYWVRFGPGAGAFIWANTTDDFQWPDPTGFPNPGVKDRVHYPVHGVEEPGGGGLPATIDTALILENEFIYDIAVQLSGNFLFASRDKAGGGYKIQTVHKTTGEKLQENASLGFTFLRGIAINPVDGSLWACNSGSSTTVCNRISKLTADGSGVLTLTGLHITTGLQNAQGIEVSPDGSYLLVTDGGTSQQIKAFNTSDGSVKSAWATSGVLGTAGGYATDPTVTNTKFMFVKAVGGFQNITGGWIAFSSDSSFWVGDSGNFRALHFSAGNSPAYVERIAWIPAFYAVHVCRGDHTRVFSDYLEWDIDYSIPMGIDNGSWTLARNWSYIIPSADGEYPYYSFASLKWVGVYSNGRTYCFHRSNLVGFRVFELDPVNGLRNTGVGVTFQGNAYVDANMDMWYWTVNDGGQTGGPIELRKNPLVGFDGSHNPSWQFDHFDVSTWPAVLTIPNGTLPPQFPTIHENLNHSRNFVEQLSNGVIPVHNPHSLEGNAAGDHVGGILFATGESRFTAHPATPRNFGQPFLTYPEAPYFTTANLANIVGISAGVDDLGGGSAFWLPGHAHFFCQYAGENWGNNQTNFIYHYHESGLLVNMVGEAAPYFADNRLSYPKMVDEGEIDITQFEPNLPNARTSFKGCRLLAGNAFNGGLAFANGKYYLYENDEWYHGGIMRWCIEDLDTIAITEQTVNWNSASYAPVVNPFDMLSGLPFDQIEVPDGAGGWHRNLPNDTSGNISVGPWLRIYTNSTQPNPFKSPDIAMTIAGITQDFVLYKDFPARAINRNWALEMEIFQGSVTFPTVQFEILDAQDRKILTLTNAFHPTAGPFNLWINGPANGFTVGIANVLSLGAYQRFINTMRDLTVRVNLSTGKLSVRYGPYIRTDIDPFDPAATLSTPARFRMVVPPNTGWFIDLAKLNFVDVGTSFSATGSMSSHATLQGTPIIQRVKMISYQFEKISNNSTWSERAQLFDVDTGDAINLTTSVDDIVVTLRDPFTGADVLTGGFTEGTTFLLPGDDGGFGWTFELAQMRALEAKTYEVGVYIDFGTERAQIIIGRLPVVRGL